MGAEEDGRREGLKQGADRERRRIRRLQAKTLRRLHVVNSINVYTGSAVSECAEKLEAATRAPRRRK